MCIALGEGQLYKLPYCLFASQNLIHLDVYRCLIKPPSTFNGFQCLKSLRLRHITIERDVLEKLITKCPLLESLTLMKFDKFSNLKIHAQRLKFVDIRGCFDDIWFKEASILTHVAIGLYVNANHDRSGQASNLLKFFNQLPRIQRLDMQFYILEYLAVGYVPERLAVPCLDMSYLSMRINFYDEKEKSVALCMLRSCPNLQELKVKALPNFQDSVGLATKFWDEEDTRTRTLFTKLKAARILGIHGTAPEMDFIRFLLWNSPSLRNITVTPASKDGENGLLRELLRFSRASVVTEIIFLDP